MESLDPISIVKEVVQEVFPSPISLLALLAAIAPVALAATVYIVSSGFLTAVVFGAVCGLAWMAFSSSMQRSRSRSRRTKAVDIAAVSQLNKKNLEDIANSGNVTLPGWCVFTEFEKANWINNQIKEVWPFVNKATCEMVKETLTPIFAAYKVGVVKDISVKHITLGNVGPRIAGIRSYKSGKDELTIEANLDWLDARDQVVTIEAETTVLASLSVKVSDVQFGGRIKIILKPLMNQIPGFGAILVAFTEQPKIDFDISILGGDITSIGGIDKMIDNIIRTSLNDMLVWPARMVIPIVPGDFSYLQLHPVGYLEIVLIEGKDIPKTDTLGKSDTFVFLYVHQKEGDIKRSSIKKNNQNPVWNESFFIKVEEPTFQDLTIRLMDDEKVEKAEFIGARKYPISKFEPNKPKELWIDMVQDPDQPLKGQKRGTIHMFVTYKPYANEEEEKNSPVQKTERNDGSESDGDGIPYEEAEQGNIGTEFMTKGEEIPTKKRGKVSGLVKKMTHKVACTAGASDTKATPAEVHFDQPVETEVVEGGDSNATSSKVPTGEGAGF